MSVVSWIETIRSNIPPGTVSVVLLFILVLGTIVEIVPVKLNPWSWIIKKIGKIANADVVARLDVVEKDVKEIRAENKQQNDSLMERDAVMARREILRFSDAISHGVSYSRDSYVQILSDIDDYERYCHAHPTFKNNMTKAATKKILHEYEVRDATNDFLN